MLFDPKWEAETKPDVFSLAGFVGWLEKQPATREYDWYDVQSCVVCQYLDASLGEAERKQTYLSSVFPAIEIYHNICGRRPWTFGAALERARAIAGEASGLTPDR